MSTLHVWKAEMSHRSVESFNDLLDILGGPTLRFGHNCNMPFQMLLDSLSQWSGWAGGRSTPLMDVTREQEKASLFETLRMGFPPLHGIIHAAMVYDDHPLRQMDVASLQR